MHYDVARKMINHNRQGDKHFSPTHLQTEYTNMIFLDIFLTLLVIANLSVVLRAFYKHYWRKGEYRRTAPYLVSKAVQ
jgi:hypothetical protein